jgi:hypothetical protein
MEPCVVKHYVHSELGGKCYTDIYRGLYDLRDALNVDSKLTVPYVRTRFYLREEDPLGQISGIVHQQLVDSYLKLKKHEKNRRRKSKTARKH